MPQASTKSYEENKEELQKTMSIKMRKKISSLSIELQSETRLKTATLVTRHSAEMLQLLLSKQEELKQELQKELVRRL